MTPEKSNSPEPFDDFKERVKQQVSDFCKRTGKTYIKAKDINEALGPSRMYTGRALAELETEWDALELHAGGVNASTYYVDHSKLEDE